METHERSEQRKAKDNRFYLWVRAAVACTDLASLGAGSLIIQRFALSPENDRSTKYIMIVKEWPWLLVYFQCAYQYIPTRERSTPR